MYVNFKKDILYDRISIISLPITETTTATSKWHTKKSKSTIFITKSADDLVYATNLNKTLFTIKSYGNNYQEEVDKTAQHIIESIWRKIQ